MKPGASGVRRLLDAAGYSRDGLRYAWRSEAAFRQGLIWTLLALGLNALLTLSRTDHLILAVVTLLLPLVELLNSAIEALTDLASPDIHPLAKAAKDMGSAAVSWVLLLQALCWAWVLWP